jgi:hypothetical protein
MTTDASSQSVVAFTVVREQGRVTAVSTNLPELNHFLDLLQNSRAHNTWVSYAHDLQLFFRTIDKLPEGMSRIMGRYSTSFSPGVSTTTASSLCKRSRGDGF